MLKRTSDSVIAISSQAVIYLTIVLFIVSLIVKGLTHEILLEAAVFLVSVKLILMAHKNEKLAEHLTLQLTRIGETLQKMEKGLPKD